MPFETDPEPNNAEIKKLIELLDTKNESTRIEAARSLGKIAIGNPEAIRALIRLLGTTKDDDTRIEAAESLGKIDPGNPEAIRALIQLLGTTKNEYTRSQSAQSLGKIAIGNPEAIRALIQLLDTTQDDYTRSQSAQSLGKIAIGNPKAIRALIQLLDTIKNGYTRIKVAQSLEKIDPGNPEAIRALIQLLDTGKPDYTRIEAAQSLGQIAIDNPEAIRLLIQLLDTTKNDYTRRLAAQSLGEIAIANPEAIRVLIQMLYNSNSYPVRRQAAEILKKIAIGNLEAIEDLKRLGQTTQSAYIRQLVTEILEVIDPVSDEQTQRENDDLLLFLQATRVKETVDEYFGTNNYKKTKFCYQRIIACLDKLQAGRDIMTRRSLMNSYATIYKRIIDFAINTKDFKTALLYAEIFRNRYLVERISQQDTPLPKTVIPELAQEINQAQLIERRRLQEYTNAINRDLEEQQLEELDRKWVEAKEQLEKLYAQVATIAPEFIAKTKISAITYKEIQAVLPSDTAILYFFFTDKQLVTMLILPGAELPIIPKPLKNKIKQATLSSFAKAWVSDISAKNPNYKGNQDIETTIQEIPQRIDQISDIVQFKNVVNSIPDKIKNLVVIPNNYLHLFPIHALFINDHQRLIDRFTVSYFPNLQVWKICLQRQRDRTTLVGIENPTQDKDLIFVKAEVASICQRQQFIQHQVLTGKQADLVQVVQLAKTNHCFHFSGHGEYNFHNPLDSYLMLSENPGENLTLNTIFADLQMPQADLVTLSACCTGVVDAFQPTDEHLGLTTGFLLAGAKAVIGSQWKVNSISSAFLFDEFYRQLETIDNKAVALQNAQNWLRRCTAQSLRKRADSWDLSTLEPKEKFRLERALLRLQGIPFESPYYWAAFILTGC